MNQLTPQEVGIIQIALGTMIEDAEAMCHDQTIPFNPQARKEMREILATAKSALAKIQLTTGHAVRLDPYQQGDEKEFLTKES